MHNREILTLFHNTVSGAVVGYKSLYECQCSCLNRDLPFRTTFEQKVLQDIQMLFPVEKHQSLVYVCQGPGGLLWDFLCINKLIHVGYHHITAIFIEPNYTTNMTILQACLDFKEWYMLLAQVHPAHPCLEIRFFTTMAEYQEACSCNHQLRGTIFIAVDPDGTKAMPDFEHTKFRQQFSKIMGSTMRTPSAFYFLYFQHVAGNPYRHMIIGRHYQYAHKPLLALQHFYGETTFAATPNNQTFIGSAACYPFESNPGHVQMGNRTITCPILAAISLNPLAPVQLPIPVQ